MLFNFGFNSSFLLFFFLQGLVFASLLLVQSLRQGSRPPRWLALFVGLCCLYIVPWMCGHAGWYAHDGYRELLFFVPFQQVLLLGPVIFMYIQSLLNPGFRVTGRYWWHFAPAALYGLYSLVVWVTDVWVLDEFYFYANGRDKDLDPWYQWTGLVSMMVYSGLSLRHYNTYRKRIFQELSFAETVVFAWVRRYLLALLLIMALRALFFVLFPDWGDFGSKFWYYLLFSGLFYYIALAGYAQSISSAVAQGFAPPANREGAAGSPEPASSIQQAAPSLPVAAAGVEEEATGPQANPEMETLKARLVAAMEEERHYENPTLTLTQLAQALGTTSKQLSATVNQALGVNFNDFVNQYRVEAVKSRLSAGDHQRFTLLSIALDCGFNSKTTFNRVFKKITGLSPAQYLAGEEEA